MLRREILQALSFNQNLDHRDQIMHELYQLLRNDAHATLLARRNHSTNTYFYTSVIIVLTASNEPVFK